MPARLGAVLCAVWLVTACSAQSAAADPVPNSATAISLAQKACPGSGRESEGRWEAQYSNGTWLVQHVRAKAFMGCKWDEQAHITAKGEADPVCEVCIPRTDRARN